MDGLTNRRMGERTETKKQRERARFIHVSFVKEWTEGWTHGHPNRRAVREKCRSKK